MNFTRQKVIPYSAKVFYMFMMFMWVASVSDLTSFNFGRNPILMPIYLIILAYYYKKYCTYSYKPLIIFLSIFVLWIIASYLKFGNYIGFQFQPIYSIIIAHVAFNIYEKDEFLRLFEKILTRFCLLSLIVWILANILKDPFVQFMSSISVIKRSPPTETYSFLVGLGSQIEMGIRRNIGFTWEPGKFACWVLIGLFINLIRHKFIFFPYKKNKNFYILFITLLTTLSTTGYSIIAILILFVLINKKSTSLKLLIIVSTAIIIPYILRLSFMSEKIIGLMDLENGLNTIEYHRSHDGLDIVCPQRFTGCYVSFLNLIHDYWLGYNQLIKSYTTEVLFKGSVIVAPSEGLINILAKYGILVGAFFYYWLYKSSQYLSEVFNYKGKFIFFIFFIAISFSYDFWENCILMYLYLCVFYKKYDSRYFDNIKTNKYENKCNNNML